MASRENLDERRGVITQKKRVGKTTDVSTSEVPVESAKTSEEAVKPTARKKVEKDK